MAFKVPMDRVGVIIGKNGSVKADIEKATGTEIEIDGSDGTVIIKKKDEEKDMIGDWIAQNILKAIARGFNPKIAMKLLEEDYVFEIIDIEAVVGNSRNKVKRIKSRIIGESGKTRKTIETLAGVHLSIYGDTIAIIGQFEELRIARDALDKLMNGQNHSSVYKFLQKKHDELKRKELTEIWRPSNFFE